MRAPMESLSTTGVRFPSERHATTERYDAVGVAITPDKRCAPGKRAAGVGPQMARLRAPQYAYGAGPA